MQARILVVVLALAVTAPLVIAGAKPDVEGTVPFGTGRAALVGVDHQRHAVPSGTVGLLLPREVTTQESSVPCAGCGVLLAVLEGCPPGMACTQELRHECLAAYARPGSVGARYAFSWTSDRGAADVLLEDLPRSAPEGHTACA